MASGTQTYWNHNGLQQEAYNALNGKLVPAQGNCETLEGEFLRAISKIYYDAYNNGGGNNVSGPLRFLQEKFPGFKDEWYSLLDDPAHGDGGYEDAYETLEQITNDVITYVNSKDEKYTPNEDDMWNYQATERRSHNDFWGIRQ